MGEPEGLEHLDGAACHAVGLAQGERSFPPFDDARADAGVPRQRREDQSGGAGAHDEDVDVLGRPATVSSGSCTAGRLRGHRSGSHRGNTASEVLRSAFSRRVLRGGCTIRGADHDGAVAVVSASITFVPQRFQGGRPRTGTATSGLGAVPRVRTATSGPGRQRGPRTTASGTGLRGAQCEVSGLQSDAQRAPHGCELRVRLAALGFGLGIRHDAGAGEQTDPIALLELTAPQSDAELPVPVAVDPARRVRRSDPGPSPRTG